MAWQKKKKKKSSGRLSIYTKYSSQSYLSCWESFSVKCSHLLTSVISYSLCFLSLSSVLPDLLWAPWPVFITSEFLQAFRPWPCVSSLWFMASPGFQTLRYKHLQDSSPWHFMGSSEIISKTAYEPYTAPSSQNNHHHSSKDRNLSKQTTSSSPRGFPISANDIPPATRSVLEALLCPILSQQEIAKNALTVCPSIYSTSSVYPQPSPDPLRAAMIIS